MDCGWELYEINIREIHLSLIRTFRYYRRDVSVDKPFAFLKDDEKYYETVVEKPKHLREQPRFVPGVGKLRSVLDTAPVGWADPFFVCFQDYYQELRRKKLILTPHYPCAIDILPSNRKKYRVITSTLPGSLKNVKEVKMSTSIRIYPAGLASLRLGWFFTSDESFRIEDVIEFLMRKRAFIDITKRHRSEYSRLSIDELTRKYAKGLVRGLLREERPLSWDFTYAIVDIINATPLTLEQNYSDVFLPLLSLDKQPEEGKLAARNLARGDEVLLPGPRSAVAYLPSADKMDRRKVRRWFRNIIELFSIQNYLIKEVETMTISDIFQQLQDEHWLRILKKGLMPPTIKHLFSVWNYLNLHFQRYPLKEKAWRLRYKKILKILDKNDEIKKSKDQTWSHLQETVNESVRASKKAGNWLKSLINSVSKWVKPFG